MGAKHWWRGILARSLFALLCTGVLLGGVSSVIIGQSVSDYEYQWAVRDLGELLDTVESTASIACFAGDEQLAAEVVQGLMRNSDVRQVLIRAGEREVARAERPGALEQAVGTSHSAQVMRSLKSPFGRELVGQIVLDADWSVINARVAERARVAVLWLAAQMLLVLLAVTVVMIRLVVRPIKATSDSLHRLEATSGQRLAVPEGHDNSEIGRLVSDINDLAGRFVLTLEQERALQQQQAIAQRMYQDLFDHAVSGIFVAQRSGMLVSFNRAFAELTWMGNRQQDSGRQLAELGWCEPEKLLRLVHGSLDASGLGSGFEDDFLLIGRRRDERWLHVAVMALGDGSVQGTITDVTARKNEELSARRLAVTDNLTGFANRIGLQQALSDIRDQPAFALLMLNLHGFKKINETAGFAVGDQVLLQVATHIRGCLQEGEIAARMGADEFVLILRQAERQPLEQRLRQLLAVFEQPCPVTTAAGEEQLLLRVNIGIACHPADGQELNPLLRHAELAQNSARRTGINQYQFFDQSLLVAVEHRRRLEDDLRHGLSAGQLHLAFQPIVDVAAGRLAGAEALLRWTHPERGMISPDVFIPIAEDLDLIGDIGLMVLEEACRHVAQWRAAGIAMYVSVNVSVKQIPDKLPPSGVAAMLKRYELPSEAIAIEITEGVLMSNVSIAQRWIESLRAAGLCIYLDDFGTGYSSLSYLKRFPMDTVKIDKSFIRDMNEDNSDRALVDAIITMARSLGLKVVAEGVETAAQVELLRRMGCGYIQGYFFSRPVSGDDFPRVVAQINRELSNSQ